jgi:hypothetical protein
MESDLDQISSSPAPISNSSISAEAASIVALASRVIAPSVARTAAVAVRSLVGVGVCDGLTVREGVALTDWVAVEL